MIQPTIVASGLVLEFNSAGILSWADVHTARFLATTSGETDERVLLAAALTVTALCNGSVCLDPRNPIESALGSEDLAEIDFSTLPWPDASEWIAAIKRSPMVSTDANEPANVKPLRFVDGLLYLERYWLDQETICVLLLSRTQRPPLQVNEQLLSAFMAAECSATRAGSDPVLRAVRTVLTSRITVLAGGPGTGKTTTIGLILRALDAISTKPLCVALAAPTGKAAARMGEALTDGLGELSSKINIQGPQTIHKLLGASGPYRNWEFGAHHQLGVDAVIIDEMSMVPLPMLATLLGALPEDARLVLVGDPDQLSSIDVGSVLGDIVAADLPISVVGSDRSVVTLTHNYRSGGNVHALAAAIRSQSVDETLSLLDAGNPDLEFIDCDPATVRLDDLTGLSDAVLSQARSIRAAALQSNAEVAVQALEQHRLLCAHRTGPAGVREWSAKIDAHLRARIPGFGAEGIWYLGRSVLITSNLRSIGLNNGDTGVVIATDQGTRVAFSLPSGVELIVPHVLDSAETVLAMTIHKSQGSQFDWVTVVLPNEDSPLLTKELLYTAVTRAKAGVRIIGTRSAVKKAIQTPVRRTSGLTNRLRSTSLDAHQDV